jgi:hypothetical protein
MTRQDSFDRTSGTGQPWQENGDSTAMTVHIEKNNRDSSSVKTGKPDNQPRQEGQDMIGQDSWDKEKKTGAHWQDTITGQSGHDSSDRTAWAGQLE